MHDSNFLYQSEAYTINSFIRLANFPVTLGFGPVKFSISTGSCVTSGRFSLFMALRWFWNWGYVDWHIWCGSKCRLQGQIIKCSRWQILVALLPTALAVCVCVCRCAGVWHWRTTHTYSSQFPNICHETCQMQAKPLRHHVGYVLSRSLASHVPQAQWMGDNRLKPPVLGGFTSISFQTVSKKM